MSRFRTRFYLAILLVVVVMLQLRCILTPSSAVMSDAGSEPRQQAAARPTTAAMNTMASSPLTTAHPTHDQEVEGDGEGKKRSTSSGVKRAKRRTPAPTLQHGDESSSSSSSGEPAHQTTALPSHHRTTKKKGGGAPIAAAPRYRMAIHVFTYNRLPGLKRLLSSLVRADYTPILSSGGGDDNVNGDVATTTGNGGTDVTLKIFMDYPKGKSSEDIAGTQPTRDFLRTFHWPHGALQLHRREVNVGLKRSIMEAWYPMGDNEVGSFFEDDVEVSPMWYAWAMTALEHYAPSPNTTDVGLLGISLFRPIHDELSGHSCVVSNDHAPFILQQPCSWGAVYLPQRWREFRDWYDAKGAHEPAELRDPRDPKIRPSSNTWDSKSSWKKYLIRLMYEKGWFMVYPNHAGTQVLSTNHLMKGEHPTPPKKLFELPLVDVGSNRVASLSADDRAQLFKFPPSLEQLRAFDVMFRKTSSGTVETLPNYHEGKASSGDLL